MGLQITTCIKISRCNCKTLARNIKRIK